MQGFVSGLGLRARASGLGSMAQGNSSLIGFSVEGLGLRGQGRAG